MDRQTEPICTCLHPASLHMKDGGCRASGCICDVPAGVLMPLPDVLLEIAA